MEVSLTAEEIVILSDAVASSTANPAVVARLVDKLSTALGDCRCCLRVGVVEEAFADFADQARASVERTGNLLSEIRELSAQLHGGIPVRLWPRAIETFCAARELDAQTLMNHLSELNRVDV